MIVSEILLINVSGDDKPGITRAVSKVLFEHGCDILDIGQAVIHDSLNLGMLAKIPQHQGVSLVQKEILSSLHDVGSSGYCGTNCTGDDHYGRARIEY